MRRRETARSTSGVGELGPEAPPASVLLSTVDQRIRRVIEVMEREHGFRLTASHLAEVIGLSQSRLQHLFKAETGGTLRPTLRDIRLSKAQTLLLESRLSIKEVASRVGFLSTPAFSRAFRKRFALPASQWRRGQHGVGRSTFG